MHRVGIGLAVAGALAASGCQSYEPRPLDLSAHREAWLDRSAADEGVAEFARRLAAEGAGGERGAFDLADGLSLREGEAVALLLNPDLRMARRRADVALATAQYAGLWEDPELGIDIERIIRSVPEPWAIGATIGLTLPVSGRLAVEKDRAAAAGVAELSRLAAAEWSVRVELRRAWLAWSAQRQRVELTRDLLERFESVLGIVSQLEAAGEVSRAEGRLLRIEQAMRMSGLRGAEMAAMELELQLKGLMGLAPAAPVPLVPAALDAAPALEDPRAAMEERNPSLAALRAEYEVAEQALRLEIRRQYPDIAIGPGLGTEEGEARVLLGLSVALPIWNRNRLGVAEAMAAREVARSAFETGYERLAAQLAVAELRRDGARAQREVLEHDIVPMVEEQDRETRRIAELGEVDTFLLLDNLVRLHETKTALIEARLAEAQAALQMAEFAGPLRAPTEGDRP